MKAGVGQPHLGAQLARFRCPLIDLRGHDGRIWSWRVAIFSASLELGFWNEVVRDAFGEGKAEERTNSRVLLECRQKVARTGTGACSLEWRGRTYWSVLGMMAGRWRVQFVSYWRKVYGRPGRHSESGDSGGKEVRSQRGRPSLVSLGSHQASWEREATVGPRMVLGTGLEIESRSQLCCQYQTWDWGQFSTSPFFLFCKMWMIIPTI